MNNTTLNSCSNMVATASNIMDIVAVNGVREMTRELDGWHMVDGISASHQNGWVSIGEGKAQWEVIVEHTGAKLSCIVRLYADGSRRTTWAVGSNMNIGLEAAMAELTNYYCQKAAEYEAAAKVAAEPATGPAPDSFEAWDAERRETFGVFSEDYDHTSDDHISVDHLEYETVVYYGSAGGRVVASWNRALGEPTCRTVEWLADAIAQDTRNYILNAAHDGRRERAAGKGE